MGEWWEWRQRWFVALSCDSLPGGDAPVSQFSSDSQTCGTCIISALVEDLGGTTSWDWHSSSHLYSLSPHSQQMLQEKSRLDFTGWDLRLRLNNIWGLQKGLVVSLAGPLWSPVACFGRGFARKQQGTLSWSTRASPALTNVSNSATPLLVAPPSHTLNRARRRTGSVSSSETAMASFPAAQIASGLISLLFHSPSISFQWTNYAKNHRVPRCSSRGRSGTWRVRQALFIRMHWIVFRPPLPRSDPR